MNEEIKFLSGITKWTTQLRKWESQASEAAIQAEYAAKMIEKEKQKVLSSTVDAKTYCSLLNISHVTLIKRRRRGLIPFVELGGRHRYFISQKGGSNG
jgi:hypothetical protein